MITAVDSSVLLAIYLGESTADHWLDRLIPDFLIAAHAQIDCDRLAAADRGYLRRYFPDLPVLTL